MAILGKRNLLSIIRESSPGLYLGGGELGEILLPGRYIPKNLAPGQKLDVFVYRDSEDRLVATTETPHAMVGEFAYMKVINVHPQVGAFLDWGLAKDLLLPFREQEFPLRIGDCVVVYVCLDAKTKRILASMRLNRHLNREHARLSRWPAGEHSRHRQNAAGLQRHRGERASRPALQKPARHAARNRREAEGFRPHRARRRED